MMLTNRYFPSLLLLSALLLLFTNRIHAGDVVELNDSNFEHQTQASTGMTTGSWFILFKAKNCAHCKRLAPEFARLANDEELQAAGVVLATVDVPTNRRTSVRFGVRGFPSLIYLHKGKLYRFKGNRLFPHLKAFLLKGVPSMQGEIIPQPLGAITEFIQTIKAAGVEFYDLSSGKSGVAGIGIVILMTLFVGLILALVVMCFMPGSKGSKEKKS